MIQDVEIGTWRHITLSQLGEEYAVAGFCQTSKYEFLLLRQNTGVVREGLSMRYIKNSPYKLGLEPIET